MTTIRQLAVSTTMAASLLAFAAPAYALGISVGGHGTTNVSGHQISTNGSIEVQAHANSQAETHSNSWFWNNRNDDTHTSSGSNMNGSDHDKDDEKTSSGSRMKTHSGSTVHVDNGLHGSLTVSMWTNMKTRLYAVLDRSVKAVSKAAHRFCGNDANTASCLATAKAELNVKFQTMLNAEFGN